MDLEHLAFLPNEHQSASLAALAFTDWLLRNASCQNLPFGFSCQWRTTFCAIAWKIKVSSSGVELFLMEYCFLFLWFFFQELLKA
jgi:hypothetical protein